MTKITGYPVDGQFLMDRMYGVGSQYVAKNAAKEDVFAVYCERRFQDISRSRSSWYDRQRRTYGLWDVFKDWLLDGEQFNKAVRFPTLRDVSKGIKTEILRTPPEANLETEFGEKKNRAEALKAKVKSVFSSLDEKRVQEECIDDMLFYGLGTRVAGYYKITKKYWGCEEDNYKEDNYKEDEITEFDDVGTERWDPRDVYFDDFGRYLWTQKKKNMKRDAFLKCSIPWSTYQDWSTDNEDFIQPLSIARNGKKMAGDMDSPTHSESSEFKIMGETNNVNLYFYYNQECNVFGAVAGGRTVIKPRPIDNEHGRIPIVTYIFERRRDSFYPNSLAELLAPAIYTQDTIFNLQLMGMKLDLMPGIMVDSELGYNPKIHKVGPRAVWQMNVPQGKDMRNMVFPFQRPPSNQNGAASMINQIESQITMTSGQDRRSLFVDPSATATQTVARGQSSQKSIQSVIFSNELEAEGHLVEMMVSDIRQYGTGKIERTVNGKKKEVYRKVKIDGFRVKQNSGNEAEFIPSQGSESLFELNEDTVDVDVRVMVQDTRTKMALQEQRVAKLNTAIPAIANVVQIGSGFDPELGKMIGWADILREWGEALELPAGKVIKNIDGEVMDRVRIEHEAMAANIEVPVPESESFEESKRHLLEHWRFRWIYQKGKRTQKETFIWTQLNEKARKRWNKHVTETQKNIKKKLEELVKGSSGQAAAQKTMEAMLANPAAAENPQPTAPARIPVPRDESPTTIAGTAKQATA